MVTQVTTLQGRAMIAQPPQQDILCEAMFLRVHGTGSGRWVIERYLGQRDNWRPIEYFESRMAAYRAACKRRDDDVVVLVCPCCSGTLGEDAALTCLECKVPIHSVGIPAPQKLHVRMPTCQEWEYALLVLSAAIFIVVELVGVLCGY